MIRLAECAAFPVTGWRWRLTPSLVTGPPAMGLIPAPVEIDLSCGGYWMADRSFVIRRRAEREALDALFDQVRGGEVIEVPCPRGFTKTASTEFSDDTLFSDGTGFAERTVVASLYADAALGDDEVTITVTSGQDLRPGVYFSLSRLTSGLGHEAHRIVTAREVASDRWLCRIAPPIAWENGHPAGKTVNLDTPRQGMRLNDNDGSAQPYYDQGRFATVALSFSEALEA